MSVYSLAKGDGFSAEFLDNLPKPLSRVKGKLTKIDEEKLFHFDGNSEIAWYLVQVESNSVYNPKSRGDSQDDRNLTLVVGEASCSTTRQKS